MWFVKLKNTRTAECYKNKADMSVQTWLATISVPRLTFSLWYLLIIWVWLSLISKRGYLWAAENPPIKNILDPPLLRCCRYNTCCWYLDSGDTRYKYWISKFCMKKYEKQLPMVCQWISVIVNYRSFHLKVVFHFQNETTDEDIISVVDNLVMVVDMTVDEVDQTQSNFDVILSTISNTIPVINEANFTDSDLVEVW